MRCFTYLHESVNKGILVSTDEKYGDVVFLGSKNPGAYFLKVGLDKEKPAKVVKGMLYYAYPRKISFTTKTQRVKGESDEIVTIPGKKVEFIVLAKPGVSKTKTLVRLMTTSMLTANTPGRYRIISGNPEVVARAYDCRRDGRGPRVSDDIIAMDDGDVILIMPEGGIRENNKVLENNNGFMSVINADEYFQIKEKNKAVQKSEVLQQKPKIKAELERVVAVQVEEPEPADECPLGEFEAACDEHIKGKVIELVE